MIPTLLMTALAALHPLADHDGCHEQAGVILAEPDGSFRATAPVTGDESHFTLRVLIRSDEHVAAIYHTHPLCGETKTDAFFSPNDVEVADTLKVPSFIWVAYDASLREYMPGKSALTSAPKLRGRIATGDVLGHYECRLIPVKLTISGSLQYKQTCIGD